MHSIQTFGGSSFTNSISCVVFITRLEFPDLTMSLNSTVSPALKCFDDNFMIGSGKLNKNILNRNLFQGMDTFLTCLKVGLHAMNSANLCF